MKINHIIKGCLYKGNLFIAVSITITLISLSACHPITTNKGFTIEQVWFENRSALDDGTEIPSSGAVVKFSNDGKYTIYVNSKYAFGNWARDSDNVLHLQKTQGNLERLQDYWVIQQASTDSMKVDIFYDKSLQAGEQEGSVYWQNFSNKSLKDPFSKQINGWRIPPTKPETDQEITIRVIKYLEFLETVFEFGLENNFSSMPAEWFPQPMLLNYSNGIRMAYSDELSSWHECFYDSTQAIKGYKIISGPFTSTPIKPLKNRYERNLNFIQALLQKIDD